MGHESFILVIKTLGSFYVFLILLRFLLQMSQADFYNPISQAVAKLTNPPLVPIRPIVPRIAGRDFSALVLAFLVQFALFLLIGFLVGSMNVLGLLTLSVLAVISAILDIYFYAVIAAVVISWIAPNSYHPAPQLIMQLTEPLFALVRKVIPPIGGIDLSPIFIFLAINLIQLQLSQMLHW